MYVRVEAHGQWRSRKADVGKGGGEACTGPLKLIDLDRSELLKISPPVIIFVSLLLRRCHHG